MAADVLQFCDSQGFEEVELIGHSVGGKVAQYVVVVLLIAKHDAQKNKALLVKSPFVRCRRLSLTTFFVLLLIFYTFVFVRRLCRMIRAVALLEPQRVKGLVVIDIAPVQYTPDEPHWKAVQDIIDSLLTVQLQPGIAKRDVDQQLRTLIPDSALRAFCLTNLDLAAGEWKIPLSYIHSQLDGLAGFDIGSGEPQSSPQHPPKQFTGDAFFIHGGQSRFVRHQHLDVIGQLFPNHMLTTIRGAGHWVHAEAPEDTTALLQRFLDR